MIRYLLTILMTIACINVNFANTDSLVTQLNDENVWVREKALSTIKQHRLTDYIPVLEDIIFEQSEPVMIKRFLEVLAYLNAENLQSITYQFIEMADNFENMFPKRDPLEMKVIATEILFNVGDYSTVNYVFELAERDYPFDNRSPLITISMLGRIINELPAYEDDAKANLVQALNNSPTHWVRMMSLGSLSRKYGSELMNQYISVCTNDEDWTIKLQAIETLEDNDYSQLNNLLRNRMLNDENAKLRDWVGRYLLKWFGEPTDYKFLKDYLPTEPDENAELGIRLELATFRPPKPDTLNWYGLTTRLITYTDELLDYEWIANETIRSFYETKLNDIIEAVQTNKVSKACSIINNTLLPTIDQHLGNNSITNEGYKFLHYYTIYIKEEIEGQYGDCP